MVDLVEDYTTPTLPHPTTLHVFNVGQGDCILVEFDTNEIMLVDCNRPTQRGIPPVLTHLQAHAEKRGSFDIDVLCLTHPDRDHYSGMLDILHWMRINGGIVRNLIWYDSPNPRSLSEHIKSLSVKLNSDKLNSDNSLTARNLPPRQLRQEIHRSIREINDLTREYYRIRQEIEDTSGVFRTANGFSFFATVASAEVYILGPTSNTVAKHSDKVWEELLYSWFSGDETEAVSTNAISCLVWILINNASILLTGDTTNDAWSTAVSDYELHFKYKYKHELTCDIVKAAHHGAKSSSSVEIWQASLKENGKVVFSAGCNEHYRHPHRETLEELATVRSDANVYCTNACSTCLIGLSLTVIANLEADSFLADDRAMPDQHKKTAYHGYCQFMIQSGGSVTAVTQFDPEPKCPLHTLFRGNE